MNELCFTVVALNLNKLLTIDFNRQKISSTCSANVMSRLFKSARKKKCK